MSRGSFLHAVSVTAAAWLVFVGHSCGAGAPLKENTHVGEVAPVPLVRIGLTRSLRDATAKVAVRGPWRLRGRADVLADGGELDWTEIRCADGGLSFGGRTTDEKILTLAPDVDGTLEIE